MKICYLCLNMCTKNQFDAKELIGRRLKNRTTCRLVKIGYSCRFTKSPFYHYSKNIGCYTIGLQCD